jgi:hypothetical protein
VSDKEQIRRSGEFRIEQNLGEILQGIHGAVEKRLDTIVEKFETHADKVDDRLAKGDTTMAVMNQAIKHVGDRVEALHGDLTTQINTLRSEVKSQSDKIRDIEVKRPVDRTPRATPALEPKKEEPWLYRAFRKGTEYSIAAVMAALALGLVLWILRGNAAKIFDTSPAAAPALPTTPATAPTHQPTTSP